MFRVLRCFVILITLIACFWASDPMSLSNVDPQLVKALEDVVEQRFKDANRNYVTMKYEAHTNSNVKSLLDDLLTAMLEHFFREGCVLELESKIRFKNYRHNELILVDTLASLRSVYINLLKWRTRNLSYTIIFIATLTDSHDLHEAVEMMWEMDILNIGIIVHHGISSSNIVSKANFSMISYWPFSSQGCRLAQPIIENHFDSELGNWTTNDFFAEKLHNFHKCPITCATWEDMPYLEIYNKTDGGQGYYGIEGELLTFIVDALNASIQLYMLNLHEIGETFNETGAIFEKEIFSGAADFCLGALLHKAEAQNLGYFSQTEHYFISHIQMVVNVFSAFSAYEKLAYPFQTSVWLLIGLTFLIGCVVIYICNRQRCKRRGVFLLGTDNRVPYYNLFILAMGANSAIRLPRRNFARFLLILWFLSTYLLRCAYQSGMYELLRNDRHRNPPNTIDSLARDRYIILMIPGNIRYMASLPQLNQKQVRFLNTSELDAFPTLLNASERQAIITPYEYFGHYRKRQPRISQNLHLVRERIFSQQLSMYVRHNSFLVDVLNRQIKMAQTYGFVQYWKNLQVLESDIDAMGGWINDQNKQNEDEMATQNILTMKELNGVFMIVLWAHLTSILIFGIELFSARIDQWRFFERIPRTF